MKKIVVAFLISITCITVNAQITLSQFKKMDASQKATMMTDSLKATLNLTEAQYPKVYAEVLKTLNRVMPVVQSDIGRFEKRSQVKAIVAEGEAKIKPVLTVHQFALYEAKKQNAIAYYRKHLSSEKLIFNVPGN